MRIIFLILVILVSGCRGQYKEHSVYHSPDGTFRLRVTQKLESHTMPGDSGHGPGYLELWKGDTMLSSSKHSNVGLVEKVIWTDSEVIVVGYEALSLPH